MNAFHFKSNKLLYILFQIFYRLVNVKFFQLETMEQLRQESQVGWFYINDHVMIMPQDIGKKVRKIATTRIIEKPVYYTEKYRYGQPKILPMTCLTKILLLAVA